MEYSQGLTHALLNSVLSNDLESSLSDLAKYSMTRSVRRAVSATAELLVFYEQLLEQFNAPFCRVLYC